MPPARRLRHNGPVGVRFRPWQGIVAVGLVVAAVVFAQRAFEGRPGFAQVSPDERGMVRIPIAGLASNQVRFYRFLNRGNQEVLFFVGRDGGGELQVAFDASENHFKLGRGFRHQGEWIVDNKCDSAFRLSEVNAGGGGCKPVPLRHRVEGDTLILAEADLLQGWRLFT